jgi:hypothetical protein
MQSTVHTGSGIDEFLMKSFLWEFLPRKNLVGVSSQKEFERLGGFPLGVSSHKDLQASALNI